ncbi:MAG TPA: helix-turn-helix domain-containing protein [Nocardioidaceae bacterium]|nr:helix-turn-helix domain-containing protein [Nocardioidaceae bacterium]
MPRTRLLRDTEYAHLLAFRVRLREFLFWSAEQAASVDLTPTQHQLLLAIRGHPDERGPSVGEVSDYLLTRHHSAGQLIARAAHLGLVTRVRDDSDDRRVVRLKLTELGEEKLDQLTTAHLEELREVVPLLASAMEAPVNAARRAGPSSTPRP